MNNDMAIKARAFEYAGNDLSLAKEYAKFLSEAIGSEDLEIRLYCIEKRAGEPVESIQELLGYFLN